jgi:hypothetical protein
MADDFMGRQVQKIYKSLVCSGNDIMSVENIDHCREGIKSLFTIRKRAIFLGHLLHALKKE